MTAQTLQEQLSSTARRMLEEAAFVFAEPDDEPAPWQEDPLVAEIRFSGPGSGRLLMASSAEFGRTLAANLLGLEPDEPEALISSPGALTEMLNIVCGALMESLYGTETICDLGIPEVQALSAAALEERCGAAAGALDLLADEEHRLQLLVFLEEPARG